MRVHPTKILALSIIVAGIAYLFFTNLPVKAAPPTKAPDTALTNFAQENGVSLDKTVSATQVTLGQPVTYTIVIENNGSRAVTPQLVDTLPDQVDSLALQVDTISATVGIIEAANNTVSWEGTLEPGAEAVISYQAIPPTTSSAQEFVENVAVLTFGETTLQDSASIETVAPDLGLWGQFINFIAVSLVFFDKILASIGVPYAFGFAIILFTITVRLLTFPLNMHQIKSSKAMQELQPQLKGLQEKHKGDREKLAQEQMKLYKEAGVNPLGGCLPMIVQMPIWFALYRALIQLASEGLLDEGFFWIPSLAGPVSDWTGGIEWLWPLPPSVGWADAIAYLVMPVLLVVSQIYMQKLMTPPSSDPQQQQMQNIMKFMPLMFGYFALIVPSGLTLYWFTSNLLGVAQHYFTKTQLNPATATAGAAVGASSAPVPATTGVAATGEDSQKKDAKKSKRRSKRKR